MIFDLKVFFLYNSDNGYIYNDLLYNDKEQLIPNYKLLKPTQIVYYRLSLSSDLHVYTDWY